MEQGQAHWAEVAIEGERDLGSSLTGPLRRPVDVRIKDLSGTGVKSTFAVTPTSLDFRSVPVNTTSAAKVVSITNTGSAVLPISSITLAGWNPYQFAQTHNCPANLAVGGTCKIGVVFKPTSPMGSKAALVNITPGGGAATRSVALAGAARN